MPRVRSIVAIRKELAAKERQLEKLQARRGAVAAKLEAVDRQIHALGGEVPARVGRPRKKPAVRVARAPRAPRARGARVGKPLTEFIKEVLAKAPAGMKAKSVTAAVLKAGYPTKDRNFGQTVAKTLAKNPAFRRVRRGVYKSAGK